MVLGVGCSPWEAEIQLRMLYFKHFPILQNLIFFVSDRFTGDPTTMMVPAATSVARPSWTILVDNVFAGIAGSVENILQPGLASIDPYCGYFLCCVFQPLPH
jgi:hypothetical protein